MENLKTFSAPTPEGKPLPRLDLFLVGLLALLFISLQAGQIPQDLPDPVNLDRAANSLGYCLFLPDALHSNKLIITQYPQFIYWFDALFYRLAGFSFPLAGLATLSFALPLFLALYLLGFQLGGRTLGWLTLLLVGENFWTILWSRSYNLNYPEMAMGALALALLLRSRNFQLRFYCLLAGPVLGLAFSSKYGALFLAAPLLWMAIVFIKDTPLRFDSKRLILFLLALLAAGGLVYLGLKTDPLRFFDAHFWSCQAAGLLLSLLLWIWLLKSKNSSPRRNFLLTLGGAAALALPWWLASFRFIVSTGQVHFATADINHYTFGYVFSFYLTCLSTLAPLMPLWMALGLVYWFFNRRQLSFQVVLIALLWGLLLLSRLTTGECCYRNALVLEPCAVLLAFAWVVWLPRGGKGLALGLGLLSCVLGLLAADPRLPDNPLSHYWRIRNYRPFYARIKSPAYLEPLAGKLIAGAPEKTRRMNLIFLNRLPDFTVNIPQLEARLLADGFAPAGSLNTFSFVNLAQIDRDLPDLPEIRPRTATFLLTAAKPGESVPIPPILAHKFGKSRELGSWDFKPAGRSLRFSLYAFGSFNPHAEADRFFLSPHCLDLISHAIRLPEAVYPQENFNLHFREDFRPRIFYWLTRSHSKAAFRRWEQAQRDSTSDLSISLEAFIPNFAEAVDKEHQRLYTLAPPVKLNSPEIKPGTALFLTEMQNRPEVQLCQPPNSPGLVIERMKNFYTQPQMPREVSFNYLTDTMPHKKLLQSLAGELKSRSRSGEKILELAFLNLSPEFELYPWQLQIYWQDPPSPDLSRAPSIEIKNIDGGKNGLTSPPAIHSGCRFLLLASNLGEDFNSWESNYYKQGLRLRRLKEYRLPPTPGLSDSPLKLRLYLIKTNHE